jgi:hypothetical protein
MTTAEVKTILGITDTTYDTQIGALLPLVIDGLQREINDTFELDPTTDDPIVPDGLKVLVANDVKGQVPDLRDIATKSLGDYSVGYADGGKSTALADRINIIRAYRLAGTY